MRAAIASLLLVVLSLTSHTRASSTDFPDVDPAIEAAVTYLESQASEPNWLSGSRGEADAHQLLWALLELQRTGIEISPTLINKAAGRLEEITGEDNDRKTKRAVGMLLTGQSASSTLYDLIEAQNDDGGWGLTGNKRSNVIDTCNAVDALFADPFLSVDPAVFMGARDFLVASQADDGSWPIARTASPSDPVRTATAVIALSWLKQAVCDEATLDALSRGATFLESQTLPSLEVAERAEVVRALSLSGRWQPGTADTSGQIRLLETEVDQFITTKPTGLQESDGSWGSAVADKAHATASTLRLLAVLRNPDSQSVDLRFVELNSSTGDEVEFFEFDGDDGTTPPPQLALPMEVNVRVRNAGADAAGPFVVGLYDGDPVFGGMRVAETVVDQISGLAELNITVVHTPFGVVADGATTTSIPYWIVVDADNDVEESAEHNNTVTGTATLQTDSGPVDFAIFAEQLELDFWYNSNPGYDNKTITYTLPVWNVGGRVIDLSSEPNPPTALGSEIDVHSITYDPNDDSITKKHTGIGEYGVIEPGQYFLFTQSSVGNGWEGSDFDIAARIDLYDEYDEIPNPTSISDAQPQYLPVAEEQLDRAANNTFVTTIRIIGDGSDPGNLVCDAIGTGDGLSAWAGEHLSVTAGGSADTAVGGGPFELVISIGHPLMPGSTLLTPVPLLVTPSGGTWSVTAASELVRMVMPDQSTVDLYAYIDPNDLVEETNELDNIHGPVTITRESAPPANELDLALIPGSLGVSTDSLDTRRLTTLSVVGQNLGPAYPSFPQVRTSRVTFEQLDESTGLWQLIDTAEYLPTLGWDSGALSAVTFSVPWLPPTGPVQVRATLTTQDYAGPGAPFGYVIAGVEDQNTDNNVLIEPFNFGAGSTAVLISAEPRTIGGPVPDPPYIADDMMVFDIVGLELEEGEFFQVSVRDPDGVVQDATPMDASTYSWRYNVQLRPPGDYVVFIERRQRIDESRSTLIEGRFKTFQILPTINIVAITPLLTPDVIPADASGGPQNEVDVELTLQVSSRSNVAFDGQVLVTPPEDFFASPGFPASTQVSVPAAAERMFFDLGTGTHNSQQVEGAYEFVVKLTPSNPGEFSNIQATTSILTEDAMSLRLRHSVEPQVIVPIDGERVRVTVTLERPDLNP